MDEPVLFYDIDGCLHPQSAAKYNEHGGVHRASDDGLFVWSKQFEDLLKEYPSVKLVCHSTWRNLYPLSELKKQLPTYLAARTSACTPVKRPRHESIKDYVQKEGISTYAILDDDAWAFPNKLKELVLVKSEQGLSEEAALAELRARLNDLVGM